MGQSTSERAVVAVVIGFAIPLISWLMPGERGPSTPAEALLQGVVIAVLVFLMSTLRQRMRSGAVEAGRALRARHERRRGPQGGSGQQPAED